MGAEGTWYNELGSRMQISVSGASLWGSYYTAVGRAIDTYVVAGRINPRPFPSPYGQALGWAVGWNNAYLNSHSTTTWSAEYQTIDGEEEIIALWLLTTETRPEDDWASTQVGKDVFTRAAPTEEQIAAHRHRLKASHPPPPPSE